MTGYYDEPDDGYDDGEVSGPVEDPEFDASPAPVPDRRYRSTTGDPTFGFILAVAISIGLAPLVGSGDPSMRYTVAWGVLAAFGVMAWLLGSLEPIREERPDNLIWGIVFGLLIGVPVMLFGGGLLGGAARRLFINMTPGEVLAYAIFVMPIAETLFFRGLLHGSRPFWMVALMSAFWSFILYLPLLDIAAFPLVAMVICLMLVLLNVMYGYVRERNGLAAAWLCQIVANLVVIVLPFVTG
ncbi:MAG: hypothetical protein IPK52_02435 [Chloroflexi bacterium]|nr:hypothetical protein [Chloroflexota bacterium]